MVFHWSVSDNKAPDISRTLRNILVDFTSAVGGMVWILPLIFSSADFFFRPLGTLSSAPLPLISSSPSCSTACSVLWQDLDICFIFSLSFIFILLLGWKSKIHLLTIFFPINPRNLVCSSDQNWGIHLYLWILECFLFHFLG